MASVKSSIRWACKEDYNYTCQFCYNQFAPNNLQIHHILRRRDGGNNHYSNLIPLCGHCHNIVHKYNYTHNSKGDRIMFLIHRVII
jgi:5-methylcytosine-specific restriction endonuclease McrA